MARRKVAKKKTAKKKPAKKRKANKAFLKYVHAKKEVDDVLGDIVGHKPISRPQITKKVWEYIKRRRGVQDGRTINIYMDEKLQRLAPRRDSITMFELTKLVSKHILD